MQKWIPAVITVQICMFIVNIQFYLNDLGEQKLINN